MVVRYFTIVFCNTVLFHKTLLFKLQGNITPKKPEKAKNKEAKSIKKEIIVRKEKVAKQKTKIAKLKKALKKAA